MPWQKRALERKALDTGESLSSVIRGLLNAECAKLGRLRLPTRR